MTSNTLKPGVVTDIPIDQLVADAAQPREAFRQKPLEDLAANIAKRGILQPITVVPSGAHQFMIKTGERRWRAAKLAGLETAPCLLDIAGGTSDDLLLDQLSENDLREDLNPMERAAVLERLRKSGMGPKQIVDHLAGHGITMSRPAVSNTLRLLKLPERARKAVANGTLKESYARLMLPFTDHPNVIESACQQIAEEKYDQVDQRYVEYAIDEEVTNSGSMLSDGDGCDDCPCKVTYSLAGHKRSACMDPDKVNAKRKAAATAIDAGAAAGARVVKKPETDPTKVKPKKVAPNKAGVVVLSRRSRDSYRSLDSHQRNFDSSECDGCPHKHLADYSGSKRMAEDHCFHPPCFENLQRQAKKMENRRERIRELIDDQLLQHLIDVAASEPVARVVVLPLLAYLGADYPVVTKPANENEWRYQTRAAPNQWGAGRSTSTALRALPGRLGRGTLTAFLERDLAPGDCAEIVAAVIRSLDLEQRRELALYLSIDIASFWGNSEDYAKLFTKPEIRALIADRFEGPDVPAGEWRQRLVDTVGVPELVREIWVSPIANLCTDAPLDDDDDIEAVA